MMQQTDAGPSAPSAVDHPSKEALLASLDFTIARGDTGVNLLVLPPLAVLAAALWQLLELLGTADWASIARYLFALYTGTLGVFASIVANMFGIAGPPRARGSSTPQTAFYANLAAALFLRTW